MPKLATKEYCTGCTACASVCPKGCITMTADENGFLCPAVDTAHCVACSLCEGSCPIITPLKMAEKKSQAYAVYSKDEAVREKSSSGGVFTEIAKVVLAEGGVVYGAAYNEQFEVVHICVDSEEDLGKLRGAKYAQSDLRGIFAAVKTELNVGRLVLFSGTPCQVAGLKAYLHNAYQNLLTLDLVCHSVPSPVAWCEYVKYRAAHDNGGKLPQSINLRSKTTGWSRYQYSNLFRYGNGVSNSIGSSESLYMKLFVGGYINRESCTNCQFKGYNRVSDLTIGDFWGIWDIAPEMDDDKGTSVVLIQSEKGKSLWNKITDKIIFKEVSVEQASQQNLSMLISSKVNVKRHVVLDKIREGNIGECEELFITHQPPILVRIKDIAKQLFHKK